MHHVANRSQKMTIWGLISVLKGHNMKIMKVYIICCVTCFICMQFYMCKVGVKKEIKHSNVFMLQLFSSGGILGSPNGLCLENAE